VLDELELLTGYHRKSLLRLLNRHTSPTLDEVDAMEEKSRRYGPEAAAALAPLLPLLVESLEQHGHLFLEPAVREQVLVMSIATIDRLLAPIRKASGGNNWRRPPPSPTNSSKERLSFTWNSSSSTASGMLRLR